jgi:hypothetical protein
MLACLIAVNAFVKPGRKLVGSRRDPNRYKREGPNDRISQMRSKTNPEETWHRPMSLRVRVGCREKLAGTGRDHPWKRHLPIPSKRLLCMYRRNARIIC